MRFVFEKSFLSDYKRIKMVKPSVIKEFEAALPQIQEFGRVPAEYNPHVLDNPGGNYNGHFEFHLAEGVFDVLVIYMPHKSNSSIRFVRMGPHSDLFGGPVT